MESLWDSGAAGHYSELVIHKGTPANVHTPSFSERRSISARRRGGLTNPAVANNPKPPIAAGPSCGINPALLHLLFSHKERGIYPAAPSGNPNPRRQAP